MDVLAIFYRKGGLLGLRQKAVIFVDGAMEFTDEKSGVKLLKKLDPKTRDQLEMLLKELTQYCGEKFYAESGAADYYEYAIRHGDCTVSWVDEPFSGRPTPRVLKEIAELLVRFMEI